MGWFGQVFPEAGGKSDRGPEVRDSEGFPSIGRVRRTGAEQRRFSENQHLRRGEMFERRFLDVDRRSGEDRRKVYDFDHFIVGGRERRSWRERRSNEERRKDWLRASKWSSVLVYDVRWLQ
jgi:hypothetical protein